MAENAIGVMRRNDDEPRKGEERGGEGPFHQTCKEWIGQGAQRVVMDSTLVLMVGRINVLVVE